MTKIDLLWLQVISPFSWPVWLRRAFLLTVPVSVPIFLILLIILVVAMLVVRISVPLASFWNSPQRKVRLNMYEYYRYNAGKKSDEEDAKGGLPPLP